MKNTWLTLPLVLLMHSGCSATIKGMQTDALNASNWTHQQMDNARRMMYHRNDQ